MLLLLGAGLMLFGGPIQDPPDATDAGEPVARESNWTRFWTGLRLGISLALLAALVWWAIVR